MFLQPQLVPFAATISQWRISQSATDLGSVDFSILAGLRPAWTLQHPLVFGPLLE
jgi:hypothetical protein